MVIDIPFALPTIVAGLVTADPLRRDSPVGIDLFGTRTRHRSFALLFVTLPFVVRTVQPVLLDLDRDVEQAAASLGRRPADHVPADRAAADRCRPSLSGAALSFARAMGEYGSVRADLQQPAVQDRGRLVVDLRHCRSENRRLRAAAAAIATVLLLVSAGRPRRARRIAAPGGPPWLS